MAFVVTQNLHAVGRKQMPEPNGSEVVSVRATAIVNGTGAINDIIPMAILPAGCIPVDWEVDSDDLDTGGAPSLTMDLGVTVAGAVSAAAGNGGKWLTASTLGQAGTFTALRGQTSAIRTAFARMLADVANRSLGFVVIAVGNGAATANSVIGLSLWYRSSYHSN